MPKPCHGKALALVSPQEVVSSAQELARPNWAVPQQGPPLPLLLMPPLAAVPQLPLNSVVTAWGTAGSGTRLWPSVVSFGNLGLQAAAMSRGRELHVERLPRVRWSLSCRGRAQHSVGGRKKPSSARGRHRTTTWMRRE